MADLQPDPIKERTAQLDYLLASTDADRRAALTVRDAAPDAAALTLAARIREAEAHARVPEIYWDLPEEAQNATIAESTEPAAVQAPRVARELDAFMNEIGGKHAAISQQLWEAEAAYGGTFDPDTATPTQRAARGLLDHQDWFAAYLSAHPEANTAVVHNAVHNTEAQRRDALLLHAAEHHIGLDESTGGATPLNPDGAQWMRAERIHVRMADAQQQVAHAYELGVGTISSYANEVLINNRDGFTDAERDVARELRTAERRLSRRYSDVLDRIQGSHADAEFDWPRVGPDADRAEAAAQRFVVAARSALADAEEKVGPTFHFVVAEHYDRTARRLHARAEQTTATPPAVVPVIAHEGARLLAAGRPAGGLTITVGTASITDRPPITQPARATGLSR